MCNYNEVQDFLPRMYGLSRQVTSKDSGISRHVNDSTLELLDFFSRCDLTFYLGLCTHLTITFFSSGLCLDSYRAVYTCFGTVWPFWCWCAIKLWYHWHVTVGNTCISMHWEPATLCPNIVAAFSKLPVLSVKVAHIQDRISCTHAANTIHVW